jgi:oligosaccharide repeat unit polymerase
MMALIIPAKIKQNLLIRVIVFATTILFYIVVSKLWIKNFTFFNEVCSILVFYSAYLITPSIRIEKVSIVSPRNLMLLVFFVRLVVCPITIFFFGQQRWKLPSIPTSEDLFMVYLLTFIAFYAFIIGWDLVRNERESGKTATKAKVNFRNNLILSIILLCCLLFIVFGFYGSLSHYLKSLFVEDYNFFHEGRSKIIIYLSILLKYGIPFLGIIIGLYLLDRIRGDILFKALIALIFIIVILFLALGPSRNNMIFPVLAFLAACIPIYFRVKFRDFMLGATGFLVLLFLFQNIRKRENESVMQDLNKVENFIEFVQVYFVSPHIMVPILRIEEEFDPVPFTLHSSLLESIPILGTSFRNKSGSYVYNIAYGRAVGPDQVFPTYGEIYLNLGLIGLIIVFVLTGFLYRKIDVFFSTKTNSDPLLRALVFYLTLLFNATIFYSYSVLGQFLFYNAIMVFIILIFKDKVDVNES